MSVDPLAALRDRFRDRARADADALADALETGDGERIEALAHGLAGAAGLFGFTGVGDRAKAIDKLYAEGESPAPNRVRDLIETIRQDMADHS